MLQFAGLGFAEMRKCTNDLTQCLSFEQIRRVGWAYYREGEVICALEHAVFLGLFRFDDSSATENAAKTWKFSENLHLKQ
ncbi:hypothetical protein [Paraburkholderia sp. BR14374]|uniref:hypothetical protein n=1 Tax=Paraburkholderia sp. BR14374 TaxID=3237007 RepID=UPI0034CD57FE